MSPRRIAYVVNVFPKLSETFIANELSELRKRGLELRVLSLRLSQNELRHCFIKRADLDSITHYDPTTFSAVLKDFQPELLHAHFATEPAAAARELSADLGVPFTFTVHGYDIRHKAPSDFAERASAASAVITVSKANAEVITQRFGVPENLLRVIPCGIDTELFSVPTIQQIGRGSPLILCVARHVKVKNLALLLEACAELRKRGIPFRCVSVGDGPCRGELEALRERLHLQGVIDFVGFAEQLEVLKWWQCASVAVLTSENEGMPVCLMEAASCGVPAVATAVGGIPELVDQGTTGLLVPRGDPSALADALERLLCNPDLAMKMGRAARLRAEKSFTLSRQVDALLQLWGELLAAPTATDTTPVIHLHTREGGMGKALKPIPISDPFGAAQDVALPSLPLALDPMEVQSAFKHGLPVLATPQGRVEVRSIRVVRHKPGKRALMEYNVRVLCPPAPVKRLTLLGKVRARRYGNEGFRLLKAIWDAGFNTKSKDGICVPKPIGVIPRFQMWLQRKVPGTVANILLAGPEGVALARRIAEGIHKLHRAGVPTDRTHTMADELLILRHCLTPLADAKPEWKDRLERILVECERLGGSVPAPRVCGIHRDFYPAQVIVDGPRLYFIDFDLYCMGDPALDVGNFVGHITEEALRVLGDSRAWRDREEAMKERFVELSGEHTRIAINAYTKLTLVRHIYLTTQFPERTACTEALMDLCEQRLSHS